MKYLLLFLLISSNSFSQKSYSFDYLIEYSFVSYKDTTTNKRICYLTNSTDNSYFAKIENLDTLSFAMEFIAHDEIWTKTKILKSAFFEAEYINGSCNVEITYKNHFKHRTEEYEFVKLPDTVINDLPLKKYMLKYVGKIKRKKSFPIGTNHYIIEDSTNFHLPILIHSTAFEEWKLERNIPNGIFKEKIFYDFNNTVKYKFLLVGFSKIKKTMIIPEDCLDQ